MSKATHAWLIAILFANLLVGALVGRDYGESWDEHLRYSYAERSLAAYSGARPAPRDEKGPFYVMAAYLGAQMLVSLAKSLSVMQAWHFMNFISFLFSLVFLYRLCLKFLRPATAIFTVLLYNTQPLLWGHAWINPKDIPFMALFMGSMLFGLNMVDSVRLEPATAPGTAAISYPIFSRRPLSKRSTILLVCISVGSLALILGTMIGKPAILEVLAGPIRQVYAGERNGIFEEWLANLMSNRQVVPIETYLEKMEQLYQRATWFLAGAVALLYLGLAAWLYPQAGRWLGQEKLVPLAKSSAGWLKEPRLWAAGLLLGFSTATRVLGPFAALLVAGYTWRKAGKQAVPLLLAYAAMGLLTTYLAWPGLWTAPVRNYLFSVTQASDYPWEGKVLFTGQDYPVNGLPRAYLPVLLSLQFSETALVLIFIGLLVGIWKHNRFKVNSAKLLVLLAWSFLPLGAAVALQPTMYDNFRQFLFTIPPLFVLAGMGMELISGKLRSLTLRIVVFAALLAPGIYWLFQLHPYQYSYYNALAGGTSGAFRRFELDYWATSYQEATEYLNQHAPSEARVIVWGADHLVSRVARPDLRIYDYRKVRDEEADDYDYAVILTRHDKDLTLYPGAPVVFHVNRGEAVFAVVKQLAGGASP
jgi:hypothetical protein